MFNWIWTPLKRPSVPRGSSAPTGLLTRAASIFFLTLVISLSADAAPIPPEEMAHVLEVSLRGHITVTFPSDRDCNVQITSPFQQRSEDSYRTWHEVTIGSECLNNETHQRTIWFVCLNRATLTCAVSEAIEPKKP